MVSSCLRPEGWKKFVAILSNKTCYTCWKSRQTKSIAIGGTFRQAASDRWQHPRFLTKAMLSQLTFDQNIKIPWMPTQSARIWYALIQLRVHNIRREPTRTATHMQRSAACIATIWRGRTVANEQPSLMLTAESADYLTKMGFSGLQ